MPELKPYPIGTNEVAGGIAISVVGDWLQSLLPVTDCFLDCLLVVRKSAFVLPPRRKEYERTWLG